MAERVKDCEQQLEESARVTAEAEKRATTAESLAGSQEQTARDLEASQRQLQGVTEELQETREKVAELQDTLEASKMKLNALTDKLGHKETEMLDQIDRAEREREAMEVERYCSVEAAGAKWEACEKRLLDQLDDMRLVIRNHNGQDNTRVSEQLAVEQQKLCTVSEELHTCEEAVQELREEKEGIRLERDELRAELAFMQAPVRRLEGSTVRTPDLGGGELQVPGSLSAVTTETRRTDTEMTRESHVLNAYAPAFLPSPP